ncbi:SLAM family member 5-like [Nelusetta ayraudi]|uniref:SLAM family member 5-like n=1 Tax=Nelusetta ayraudi TaxID=303726 RepID=UPI003F6E44AB
MGRRRVLSLFLLCLSWVTVRSVMYELKSEQAQLGPSILPQEPDSILWKHNGNKVVEFAGSEESVYGSYEGRIILYWHTAQLQISDLRLEDSGTYEYEIMTGGKLHVSSYELEVIEKVVKPAITCEINNSSSNLSAVLLCSVGQPRSPLMFEWSSDRNVQSGETLTIFLGGELDERQYTCRVSNPVSQETATFTAKDCNTDTGLSSGMVVVIVLIILMVCVGLLMLLYMLKRKDLACFKNGQQRDLEMPTPSKGPHKKSAEEKRTRAIERETTLPSSRPLASYQDLHEESRRDEEKKPLLTGQPTATSPPLQNQLGAENAHDVESQQWPQKGTVRERVKKIEQRDGDDFKQIFNTPTSKKTGNLLKSLL